MIYKETKLCGKNHRDYKRRVSIAGKIEEKLKCLIGVFKIYFHLNCREYVYITARYIKIMIPIVPVLQKTRLTLFLVEFPTFLVQHRHFATIHKHILLSPETTIETLYILYTGLIYAVKIFQSYTARLDASCVFYWVNGSLSSRCIKPLLASSNCIRSMLLGHGLRSKNVARKTFL